MLTKDLHGNEFGNGWYGVDLDGTLAEYHGWKGIEHIGAPIPKMVEQVKQWLAEGKRVKIMTARVAPVLSEPGAMDWAMKHIREWLRQVFGEKHWSLEITHEKDRDMIELWDDRCVQVEPNTGTSLEEIVKAYINALAKATLSNECLRKELDAAQERLKLYDITLRGIANVLWANGLNDSATSIWKVLGEYVDPPCRTCRSASCRATAQEKKECALSKP